MPGTRSSYLGELDKIQRRLHQLFESALLTAGFDSGSGAPGTWAPQVDLVETASAFEIHAELPGVSVDDIDVEVHDPGAPGGPSRLEISGHRSPIDEAPAASGAAGETGGGAGHGQFLQMERNYGPFRRGFDLASAVDASTMTVRLEHGILSVTLPKA